MKKMQKGIFINFDSEKVPSVTVLVASGSRTVKNGRKKYPNCAEKIREFQEKMKGHFCPEAISVPGPLLP